MEIRRAALDDGPTIAEIHRMSRHRSMPWLPVLHTPEGVARYFTTVVLATGTVRIACDGPRPVGYASVKDDWLNHLYVHPDHWGRGAGHALLTAAMSSADRLQLWAFQRNERARRFYAAHGFEEVELTDGRNNEEKTPDVRMEWVRTSDPA